MAKPQKRILSSNRQVVTIFPSAFGNDDHMISVVIPDTVTRIGTCAFIGNDNLTTVVMGSSVTQIDNSAFAYCYKLKELYYKGTAEDWKKIKIDIDNYELTAATRYYYDETQPTEEGNYWRYDEKGEIAVW